MKLTNEQIKSVIFGAVETEETERGLRFYKNRAEERESWLAASEGLGTRSRTTTGIMADFHTNSTHVHFTVWNLKFEVLVNGGLVYQVQSATEKAFHPIDIDLDGNDNRVTLVFPNHRDGYLRDISVDDGAYVTPHKYDTKFLFVGDSITQGWNSTYDSLSYAHRISEMFNAERVINGIGGAFFRAEAFRKIDYDPDVVVIAYGTNDLKHYTDKAEFEKNVTEFLDKITAAYPRAKFVDILPIYRFDADIETMTMGTIHTVRDFIKKACEERGIATVDGFQLVPHLPEFFADYLHPNDLGFQLYAENLRVEFNRILGEKK